MHARRLRGNGRNKRDDDSSDESEEEHSHSDDDDDEEEDTGDETGDSVGERPLLNSEEDPSATRRPGRDARARAKVNFSFKCYHLC